METLDLSGQARAKACCADLYQSQSACAILEDTLHSGGLALTNRLGRLMDIQPGDWVVDLASARGNSAMAVSRVFKCNVVGVEFGREAVLEAHAAAQGPPKGAGSYYLQGDAERPPLRPGFFDGAFCECSVSLFLDKPGAVAETVALLRPGGRFGISDVTVEPDSRPAELGRYPGPTVVPDRRPGSQAGGFYGLAKVDRSTGTGTRFTAAGPRAAEQAARHDQPRPAWLLGIRGAEIRGLIISGRSFGRPPRFRLV